MFSVFGSAFIVLLVLVGFIALCYGSFIFWGLGLRGPIVAFWILVLSLGGWGLYELHLTAVDQAVQEATSP